MKLFAIFFSFYIFILSLAPNMKGVELLKIGNLIEHYQQHLERNDGSSWLDFITEHYFADSIDYEKEHQEMPFKHNSISINSVFIENESLLSFESDTFHEEKTVQKPITVESNYHLSSIYSIWHPPRI
jgi:hypothetical protein